MRITVDTEVYTKLTDPMYVGKSPNQALRVILSMPETKAYRPRRKRNWLQKFIRKVLK